MTEDKEKKEKPDVWAHHKKNIAKIWGTTPDQVSDEDVAAVISPKTNPIPSAPKLDQKSKPSGSGARSGADHDRH